MTTEEKIQRIIEDAKYAGLHSKDATDQILRLLDEKETEKEICDCMYSYHQTDKNGREYCRKCGRDWNVKND